MFINRLLFFLSRGKDLKFTKQEKKFSGSELPTLLVLSSKASKDSHNTNFTMPPTPKAILFVLPEIRSPQQVETLVCTFWPPGFPLSDLRALLSTPAVSYAPYHDHLVDVATQLILAGHQRSPRQVLEELGFLPPTEPLPPIQVTTASLSSLFIINLTWCVYFRLSF
jgi:hypothetical protein